MCTGPQRGMNLIEQDGFVKLKRSLQLLTAVGHLLHFQEPKQQVQQPKGTWRAHLCVHFSCHCFTYSQRIAFQNYSGPLFLGKHHKRKVCGSNCIAHHCNLFKWYGSYCLLSAVFSNLLGAVTWIHIPELIALLRMHLLIYNQNWVRRYQEAPNRSMTC
jgi:hypothetical protein